MLSQWYATAYMCGVGYLILWEFGLLSPLKSLINKHKDELPKTWPYLLIWKTNFSPPIQKRQISCRKWS